MAGVGSKRRNPNREKYQEGRGAHEANRPPDSSQDVREDQAEEAASQTELDAVEIFHLTGV